MEIHLCRPQCSFNYLYVHDPATCHLFKEEGQYSLLRLGWIPFFECSLGSSLRSWTRICSTLNVSVRVHQPPADHATLSLSFGTHAHTMH